MNPSPWDGPPLRIAHVISSEFAGGPEKQIVSLSQRLIERGWSVSVGSFLEGRDDVEILERARAVGVPTYSIATRHPFDPSAVGQLRAFLKEQAVDVLVSHGYKGNVLGRIATLRSPTAQIAMVRGFTFSSWKIRRYEQLDRLALRFAPLVLCVSHGTTRVLEGHGLRGSRYQVLHNAVDCSAVGEPIDLRQEYGYEGDAKIVVAAGRLSPEKGHRILVDAMRLVHDRLPQVRCLCFGEGGERPALLQQIQALGLEDVVRLPGFRRDVLGVLAGADLVVNPSFSEGLPNVVLEAMAQRSACVATEVGGVGELIEDGHSGWLVPSGNASALAEAICEALTRDDERARRASVARRVAEERFSFDAQAERFAQYCRALLAARGRGGSRQ